MFATREAVQESLGFSPFELVFGHSVRGPLAVMKDAVLQNAGDTNVLTYVSTFGQRLLQVNEHAKNHLDEAQARMKTWFDCKAKDRYFAVGQKVLVLLPCLKGALQARFEGPYTITKEVSEVDIIVRTPSRDRL